MINLQLQTLLTSTRKVQHQNGLVAPQLLQLENQLQVRAKSNQIQYNVFFDIVPYFSGTPTENQEPSTSARVNETYVTSTQEPTTSKSKEAQLNKFNK